MIRIKKVWVFFFRSWFRSCCCCCSYHYKATRFCKTISLPHFSVLSRALSLFLYLYLSVYLSITICLSFSFFLFVLPKFFHHSSIAHNQKIICTYQFTLKHIGPHPFNFNFITVHCIVAPAKKKKRNNSIPRKTEGTKVSHTTMIVPTPNPHHSHSQSWRRSRKHRHAPPSLSRAVRHPFLFRFFVADHFHLPFLGFGFIQRPPIVHVRINSPRNTRCVRGTLFVTFAFLFPFTVFLHQFHSTLSSEIASQK